ncbi:ABC transporter permease [Dyella mobilis]|uniref:ABC transporter permease n=1 Tax=Dyella mobilis TaxID=1849582 RepID=A0ABS2KHY5_9GAMM|nr:ABC transporter permease [Dyella mobilis]MBM7130787.1 ABC transporter permease [Dyella mobilis]GLQ97416.1 ABC transporter ATP-binding protein [Dyella mobilis]
MFAYYFQLGLRSLRRNPILTALMVIAIGVGVAASMTAYSVFRVVSGNPIPEKASQLYAVQIDNYGPQHNKKGEPPDELDYTDALALQQTHKAIRETSLYPVLLSVIPANADLRPIRSSSYAMYADAFKMFDIPFLYGRGWSASDDQNRTPVVVIGRALNERLFHGVNSVGQQIDLNGQEYRITGVIDSWDPQPRFFDPISVGPFGNPIQLFIPMSRAVDQQLITAGNTDCPDENNGNGWDAFLHSDCVWLLHWVELPSTADARTYRQYLQDYAAEQQRVGRFEWPPNIWLRNVTQWLDHEHVVPPETSLSLYVSLGFLLICLVNTVGLLLAKFLRRAPEIGVRRALGASRRTIYAQFLLEGAAIGLAGGVLGLLLTGVGVWSIGLVFDARVARLATVDLKLMASTLGVAILAAVLAALYPTWRAAKVQPAWQLKTN